jgi:hypothetical protein
VHIIKGNADFRNRKSSYHCIQHWAFRSQSWNVMQRSLVEVTEETAPSIFTPHFYTEKKKKSTIFLPDYTASHPKDHNLNSQPLYLIVSDTSTGFIQALVAPNFIQQLSAISVLSLHLTCVLTMHLSS